MRVCDPPQENIVTCQQAAVNFVDFAIESTLIEPVGNDGDEGGGSGGEPRRPLAVRLLDLLHSIHLAVPKVSIPLYLLCNHCVLVRVVCASEKREPGICSTQAQNDLALWVGQLTPRFFATTSLA